MYISRGACSLGEATINLSIKLLALCTQKFISSAPGSSLSTQTCHQPEPSRSEYTVERPVFLHWAGYRFSRNRASLLSIFK